MLFNCNNKKVYIGQTENFNRRAYQHLYHFKKGSHPHKEMLADYQNGDLFYFSILEKCKNISQKELKQLEKIYMLSFLECGYHLYNEETKEVLKDLLFQEIIVPRIEQKQKEMRKRFNMPIPHLSFCGLNKLKEILNS